MKAIKIDSKEKRLYWVEIKELEDMQKEVGGFLELAYSYKEGKESFILYVDEDGFFKGNSDSFIFKGAPQPMYVGDGLVVSIDNKTAHINDFTADLEKLKEKVKFN